MSPKLRSDCFFFGSRTQISNLEFAKNIHDTFSVCSPFRSIDISFFHLDETLPSSAYCVRHHTEYESSECVHCAIKSTNNAHTISTSLQQMENISYAEINLYAQFQCCAYCFAFED